MSALQQTRARRGSKESETMMVLLLERCSLQQTRVRSFLSQLFRLFRPDMPDQSVASTSSRTICTWTPPFSSGGCLSRYALAISPTKSSRNASGRRAV